MSGKRVIRTILVLLATLSASITSAAELRGRLTGLPGAYLKVDCSGSSRSSAIGSDGTYAITGLPSGVECSFTVSSGSALSGHIPFNTSTSVTIYNGRLSLHDNRILVIRQ